MSDNIHDPSVIAYDVYRKFAYENKHIVEQNPICQECGKNPSVRINRWGTIKACCKDCLNKEQERFNQYCKEQDELEKELKDYW